MSRRLNLEQVIAETQLTPAEKLFYVYLVLRLCDESGRCQQTINEMNEQTHLANGTISKSIHSLIKTGYIRAKLHPNRSGHESWLIHLTDAGLLKEEEVEPPRPPATLPPETTTLEAGNVRIIITVEARET